MITLFAQMEIQDISKQEHLEELLCLHLIIRNES